MDRGRRGVRDRVGRRSCPVGPGGPLSVVDASVFVDALVGGKSGVAARRELRELTVLVAPALFPAEVTSAVRALVRGGRISPSRAHAALIGLAAVRVQLHPFAPVRHRVWELRENLTVYDAWYVALAEKLDEELLTADRRLASAPGSRCVIRQVGGS